MKNTTEVPNEVIINAHKEACQKWKTIIEGIAPELFKAKFKFEKGKWYIHNDGIAMFLSSGEQLQVGGVGINGNGDWTNEFYLYDFSQEHYRLATPSEIESHLIKEAKKRGFNEGVRIEQSGINSGFNHFKNINGKFEYHEDSDQLDTKCGNGYVYSNGKWATIISEPLELTLDEIAKKLGVDAVKIKK